MLPAESLMKYLALGHLPRKRKMAFQIICLPKNSWNPTDDQTLLITSPCFFYCKVAAFRALVYRDGK